MLRTRIRPAGFIEPCQPTTVPGPPSGPGWLHEIKYDGYRMMALRTSAGVRLLTRKGNDMSDRYPLVTKAVEGLPAVSCLIDGEMVCCDANGLPVFDLLQSGPQVKHDVPLFAFDLLELDGKDLRSEAIEQRKRRLASLLMLASSSVTFVDHVDGSGGEIVFAHACALGCEGIVSKRLGSRYRSGKSDAWVKVRNLQRQP
jgi:bifunctional non-homologous end joining protein LigD